MAEFRAVETGRDRPSPGTPGDCRHTGLRDNYQRIRTGSQSGSHGVRLAGGCRAVAGRGHLRRAASGRRPGAVRRHRLRRRPDGIRSVLNRSWWAETARLGHHQGFHRRPGCRRRGAGRGSAGRPVGQLLAGDGGPGRTRVGHRKSVAGHGAVRRRVDQGADTGEQPGRHRCFGGRRNDRIRRNPGQLSGGAAAGRRRGGNRDIRFHELHAGDQFRPVARSVADFRRYCDHRHGSADRDDRHRACRQRPGPDDSGGRRQPAAGLRDSTGHGSEFRQRLVGGPPAVQIPAD